MIPIYIILAVLLVVIFLAVGAYNTLIGLKNKVRESASDIDVQLKRRYDLIPNLIETVKGAKAFESETLEKVIKARQQAIDVTGLGKDKAEAENVLSGTLRQLFALSESYPDLKSNQNFSQLQDELTNTEDRILASRRFYNNTVSDYNTIQDQFPTLIFKGLAGAKLEPFFELENPQEERKNVKVQF
ncbi:MAG: LemA family protein [bacterium]